MVFESQKLISLNRIIYLNSASFYVDILFLVGGYSPSTVIKRVSLKEPSGCQLSIICCSSLDAIESKFSIYVTVEINSVTTTGQLEKKLDVN